MIVNLLVVVLVLLLIWLCYVGISKFLVMNMVMVVFKIGLIVLVIVVGWKYVDISNWILFILVNEGLGKYGMEGVLCGVVMVFFVYIGFEVVLVVV